MSRPTRTVVPVGLGVLLSLASLAGCNRSRPAEPEPISECEEYQRTFRRCTGIAAPIATEAAALVQSKEERSRLAEACSSNLAQLQQACR
jgi:hypothetical protein